MQMFYHQAALTKELRRLIGDLGLLSYIGLDNMGNEECWIVSTQLHQTLGYTKYSFVLSSAGSNL